MYVTAPHNVRAEPWQNHGPRPSTWCFGGLQLPPAPVYATARFNFWLWNFMS